MCKIRCPDKQIEWCKQELVLYSFSKIPSLSVGLNRNVSPPGIYYKQIGIDCNGDIEEITGINTEMKTLINFTRVMQAFKNEDRIPLGSNAWPNSWIYYSRECTSEKNIIIMNVFNMVWDIKKVFYIDTSMCNHFLTQHHQLLHYVKRMITDLSDDLEFY